jgi:hypothetical protein
MEAAVPHVRGHYRRNGFFRSSYVQPHYRRPRSTRVLMIVGGVLLAAFVLIVLMQST